MLFYPIVNGDFCGFIHIFHRIVENFVDKSAYFMGFLTVIHRNHSIAVKVLQKWVEKVGLYQFIA